MDSFTIETIPRELDDETACAINAFENTLLLELDSAASPMPVSMTKAYAKYHDPNDLPAAFAAWSEDRRVVGTAWIVAPIVDNDHMAFARGAVARDFRRSGVGTALLRAFVEFASEQNRDALVFGADLLHPSGQRFAAAVGATPAMQAHVNQLLLSELPPGLIDEWISAASDDYELVWVPDNEFPEEWLDDLIVVSDVLQNDAPMDGLPINERHTTAEQLRAHVERVTAFGREFWTLIAKHRATGEPVGYTEMLFPGENPQLASQGATAVSAKHRGHALGRWLKAAMLERVIRERPEVTKVRTFNADSNDPMLAINFAMGFKALYPACRWTIERHAAQAWLEKRQ